MKKLLKIIDYLLVFYIILNFKSVYSQSYNKNYYINYIIIILMSIEIFLYLIPLKYGKHILKHNLKLVTYLLIYIFIFYILNVLIKMNQYYVIFWINFGLIILLLDIVIKLKNRDDDIKFLIKAFVNEIILLSGISIILYFGGTIFKIIKPTGQIKIIWGAIRDIKGYYGLHFETQSANGIIRNSGIFVEAPIYASILSIALALKWFVLKNKKKMGSIIILITLFTTLTTTGIIYVIICMIIYLIFNKNNSKLLYQIKILSIPLIFFIMISIMFTSYFEKLDSNSAKIRMDDFVSSIKTWTSEPVFGVGYLNLNAIRKNMADFRSGSYEMRI